MIRIRANTAPARTAVVKVQSGLTPAEIDPVIDRVGLQVFADVVQHTPKKWFGQVRAGWTIQKPGLGQRIVVNRNKVMLFLEEGTANAGTGFIVPKIKKFLYIPLTRSAAAGWHSGLKRGIDYIMKKAVRGIAPRKIVAAARERARVLLLNAMKAHIRRLIHG